MEDDEEVDERVADLGVVLVVKGVAHESEGLVEVAGSPVLEVDCDEFEDHPKGVRLLVYH